MPNHLKGEIVAELLEGSSFNTRLEEQQEELTIFVRLAGNDNHEKMFVKKETQVAEAVAELMGSTRVHILEQFTTIHKGKTLNPMNTVEEAGVKDQNFLVIVPKLKGGRPSKPWRRWAIWTPTRRRKA